VFSTLHTNNAAQTVDRIIDSYPADQQAQIRGQLGLVLRAIVSMQLVEDKEQQRRLPACEILVNSPKISKHITNGEIKEILEEMENSVNFYRMQSMNQSLIGLLAHNQITYEQAVEASPEPDDLSLKLREMFPSIEDKFREGDMAPSPADFSQITELLETKRLFEESEERHRMKVAEKDEQIEALQSDLASIREQLSQASEANDGFRREAEIARAEVQRFREDSQQTINTLNERIRELNQQLQDGGGGGKGGSSGFFKR
jgi:twitching motility protein PilT